MHTLEIQVISLMELGFTREQAVTQVNLEYFSSINDCICMN